MPEYDNLLYQNYKKWKSKSHSHSKSQSSSDSSDESIEVEYCIKCIDGFVPNKNYIKDKQN